MSAQFSAGPWSLEPRDDGASGFRLYDGSGELIDYLSDTRWIDERDDPEQIANLTLIAAAPELYAALDQLHRETLLFLKRDGKTVGKTGPGKALYDMVERALARARGDSNE